MRHEAGSKPNGLGFVKRYDMRAFFVRRNTWVFTVTQATCLVFFWNWYKIKIATFLEDQKAK
jgi:hypothetical protein